ncbi:MAG: cytochrome C oxidase subunit IV family protein [Sphingobacteriales bacterium]|nr:cytochrome C oxidase subunit IV family protein [Sphingobacteriales bacterium]
MRKNKIIWLLLILFTLITAFISRNHYALIAILLLADIKLFLVAFHFMELKKAHTFWRMALSLLIVLITLSLFMLRS